MGLNLTPGFLIACLFIVCLSFVYLMVRIIYGGEIKIDEGIGAHGTQKYVAVIAAIVIISIILTVLIGFKVGLL